MKLFLSVKEIADQYVQGNFQKLKDFLDNWALNKMDLSFIAIRVPTPGATVANFTFPHGLGYTPKDIIVTSIQGTGTVTWNYDKFDGTNLNLSVAGATPLANLDIRLLVGNYA